MAGSLSSSAFIPAVEQDDNKLFNLFGLFHGTPCLPDSLWGRGFCSETGSIMLPGVFSCQGNSNLAVIVFEHMEVSPPLTFQ